MARRDKNIWIKFETKSNRVKGLAFHPKRPWILASLHDGTIQLWDYRMETLIEKYEEHDGPVRGIHFHATQPLFVSGGDDYKIKVWNYQRCLFNLLGHLDYIRTVQFHHEYPWIISASDDQTIRIWNWQSRTCLSVLTGHNHYVMSASFHPKEDLIISASLDQTVRVWDFSVLRKKNVSIATDFGSGGLGSQPDNLFGNSDVVVRHVLEGHSRGVNWASFHPSLNLIVSGADDREVKLWRMNDTKAWEIDTMRGHISNVSCVMFHPKKDLVISNSEDKSIRVWDTSKQTSGSFSDWPSSVSGAQQVFRRDHDRYWILDVHQNLIAAGHDSGLLVFKLNRERPAMDTLGPRLYFCSKLFVYEMDQRKDSAPRPILTIRASQEGRRGQLNSSPRTLSYNFSNQSHHCILLCWDQDSSYELYTYPKTETGRDAVHSPIRGFGRCAVFVSRSRFAVLDRQRVIYLKNLKNESKRKIQLPNNPAVSYIFPGGLGKLLIRSASGMILYDCEALRVIAEFTGQTRHPIKYVSWSANNKFVAMWSKTNIFILDAKISEQCSITETSRIKSGSWDPIGVFVYTTHTHIKYLLPNGDNGVIKTLDFPIYLTGVHASTIYYIDREEKTGKLSIDTTEYQFKIALMENRKKEVLEIINSKKLVGASIIAYLEKKGFPELALHFVEDDNIKFSLALECGNITVASECAKKLDKKECWHKLGVEGLRQGNHEVVEAAYQKTKNFERLSFLYLITGNIPNLQKMLRIAAIRKDRVGMFHNALYLGDVEERVKVLTEAGQLGLALLTAKTHGLPTETLEEQFRQHYEQLGQPVPEIVVRPDAKLFLPPQPILQNTTWPLLEVKKGFFDDVKGDDEGDKSPTTQSADYSPKMSGKKGEQKAAEEDEFLADFPGESEKQEDKSGPKWRDTDGDLSGILGDIVPDPADPEAKEETADADDFVLPSQGKSIVEKWSSSFLAADMIAAGQFDQAMHLLNRQIGVINFEPLKSNFMTIFNSATCLLPTLPSSSPLTVPLTRDENLPLLAFKLENCVEELKLAYKAVSDGQFKTAIDHFTNILHTIPFVVVEKKAQEQEAHELISVCKEYLTAMRIETARREEKVEPIRQAALSAYFTHCKIQTIHLLLGLKIAIKCSYTINNFVTTARFCRRVLELVASTTSANVTKVVDVKQIKAVLKVCERKETDAQIIDYDESKVFSICCETLTPVYRGKPEVRCPYCQSAYHGTAEGSLCKTCQLSKVGAQTTGLRCFSSS